MTTNKAINVSKAIETLADFFGEDVQNIAISLVILNSKRKPLLNDAIKLTRQFYDSDIVERGKLLGMEITVSQKPLEGG